MNKLLVVEDAPEVREMIVSYLAKSGFDVHQTGMGRECLRMADEHQPAAVILDIGLPDLDGISVASRLRARYPQIGIILVTISDDDFDRVAGLETGADCFITKPVNMRVLLAQLRSLLRRRPQSTPEQVIRVGDYRMDLIRRRVLNNLDDEVALTAGEFALLVSLIELRGRPVPRADLVACLRPLDNTEVDPRSVDVLIGRLRRKLEVNPNRPSMIQTIHGKGYRLAEELELD